MCGIAGILNTETGPPADEAIIHRMCQSIVHRGPDDEGKYVKGNVGLGMRRLSIIDLAGGHQPIHNEDKTVWVVFNGEIYNFPELRSSLERRGHRFYTNTDTEVIAHLYEDLGADLVQKLRGMFALAIYDERHHRLVLARDRLGKKPLHYAFSDGRLLLGRRSRRFWLLRRNWPRFVPKPNWHTFILDTSPILTQPSAKFKNYLPGICSNSKMDSIACAATGIFRPSGPTSQNPSRSVLRRWSNAWPRLCESG